MNEESLTRELPLVVLDSWRGVGILPDYIALPSVVALYIIRSIFMYSWLGSGGKRLSAAPKASEATRLKKAAP